MNHVSYFIELLGSFEIYRKFVSSMLLNENNEKLLTECGYSKSDINRVCLQFKKILVKPNKEDLDYMKNEEESIVERILNK